MRGPVDADPPVGLSSSNDTWQIFLLPPGKR